MCIRDRLKCDTVPTLFFSFFTTVIAVSDDIFSPDDTNEDLFVIDDRNKILIHGGKDQILDLTVHIDRFVVPASLDAL